MPSDKRLNERIAQAILSLSQKHFWQRMFPSRKRHLSQAGGMGFGTKQVVLFSKEASLSSIKIILIGTKQLVLFMEKSGGFYTESTFPCHPCRLVVTDNCLITK